MLYFVIFSAMALYVFFCNTMSLSPVLRKLFKVLCDIGREFTYQLKPCLFLFNFLKATFTISIHLRISVTHFSFVSHNDFPIIKLLSSYIDVYFLNLELRLCLFLITIHRLIIGRNLSIFLSIIH